MLLHVCTELLSAVLLLLLNYQQITPCLLSTLVQRTSEKTCLNMVCFLTVLVCSLDWFY